jgi:hypothetical protein
MLSLLLLVALQQTEPSGAPTSPPILNRDLFGVSIDRAGDLDGDGVEDLWVADPSDAEGSDVEPYACIWAVSGARGEALLRIAPPEGAHFFGSSVCALGDLDGDGVSEVATSCLFIPTTEVPEWKSAVAGNSPQGESTVFLFSGRSGALRLSVRGPADDYKASGESLFAAGPALRAVGDWNDDGACDLAVGWAYGDSTDIDCGRVVVVSGTDGSVLQSWHGEGPHDRLGTSLCKLTDLDGDGRAELAACAFPVWDSDAGPQFPQLTKERAGYVQILASKGGVLRTFRPSDHGRSFGLSLAPFPDADADGVDDLVLGRPFGSQGNDIRLFSLGKGALLRRFPEPYSVTWASAGRKNPPPPGPPARTYEEAMERYDPQQEHVGYDFGTRLLAIPDRDGDGRADLLVTVAKGGGFLCTAYAGALSSKTGRPIALVPNLDDVWVEGESQCLNYLGVALCSLPDMDGDSVDDFAIGGGSGVGLVCPGAVVICSGKEMIPLRFILSTQVRR